MIINLQDNLKSHLKKNKPFYIDAAIKNQLSGDVAYISGVFDSMLMGTENYPATAPLIGAWAKNFFRAIGRGIKKVAKATGRGIKKGAQWIGKRLKEGNLNIDRGEVSYSSPDIQASTKDGGFVESRGGGGGGGGFSFNAPQRQEQPQEQQEPMQQGQQGIAGINPMILIAGGGILLFLLMNKKGK